LRGLALASSAGELEGRRHAAATVTEGELAMGTKDVRETVEAELRFDPLIDESDITVMNITGWAWGSATSSTSWTSPADRR
jgi:hypothetical protein